MRIFYFCLSWKEFMLNSYHFTLLCWSLFAYINKYLSSSMRDKELNHINRDSKVSNLASIVKRFWNKENRKFKPWLKFINLCQRATNLSKNDTVCGIIRQTFFFLPMPHARMGFLLKSKAFQRFLLALRNKPSWEIALQLEARYSDKMYNRTCPSVQLHKRHLAIAVPTWPDQACYFLKNEWILIEVRH